MRESNEEDELSEFNNLDANLVIDSFGKYGRFQVTTCAIANMVYFSCCVNAMIIPLTSDAAEANCEKNISAVNETPHGSANFFSFADEFGLVCERKRNVDHASSLYLMGSMLVGPVVLQLSDLYGRRLPFLCAIYASIIANFTAACAPSYSFFLVARFISGISDACFFTMASTIAAESVSSDLRNLISLFFNFYWISGYMFIGVLRLYVSHWRWLWAAAALPGLLALPFYRQIPESLHWLIAKKRNQGVKDYIDKVSRYNHKTIDLKRCHRDGTLHSNGVRRTVFDIFRSPALLRVLVVNGFIYVVLSCTYWALSLFSTDLSSDKMTGFFLSGLVELPGALLGNLMIYRLNRRTVSFVSLIAMSISLAAATLSPANSISTTLLSLIAKCFAVVLICNQPLFCMESSPTSVRSIILGIVGFMRDLGAALTPYIRWFNVWGAHAPIALISILAAIASSTVFLLHETRGKELSEDIGTRRTE